MEKSSQNIFTIKGAYEWFDTLEKDSEYSQSNKKRKNTKSVDAIKSVIDQVNKRIKTSLSTNSVKIRYSRLRATAGSFLMDGIRKRIKNSQAVIFDITSFNPNVMLELGLALEAAHYLENAASIYLICEGEKFDHSKIPSDLSGYFISFYQLKNRKLVFHDSNSLAMRLVSDIADFISQSYIENEN